MRPSWYLQPGSLQTIHQSLYLHLFIEYVYLLETI